MKKIFKKLIAMSACVALILGLALTNINVVNAATTDEVTFAEKMKELDTLAQSYTGKISGSFTGANAKQWAQFMYIRHFNGAYTSSKWEIAGGKIDNNFINYVASKNPTLNSYFASTSEVNGVDLRHMAATISANMHKNTGTYILAMRGYQWNDLSGWAGDLQTFLLHVRSNTSGNYNAYYQATLNQMGKWDSTYDISDLKADVDAVNIANMISRGNSVSTTMESYYKNGGSNKRFTTFINGKNKSQLASMAKEYVTAKYKTPVIVKRVWDIYKSAGVSSIDSNMTNGISDGYADYLLQLAHAE